MATCTKCEWDVSHGKFYAAVEFPAHPSKDGALTIHDVALRVSDGLVTVEPPPCVSWPLWMSEDAQKAIVKYLRAKAQTKPFSASETKKTSQKMRDAGWPQ